MDLAKLNSTKIVAKGITFSIIYHQQVDSTNAVAYRLASEGAAEGTVVVADVQDKGRGRLGRKWLSPSGKNIYASLILRPTIEPQYASQIPLIAGLAVHNALAEYLPNVSLKWPNDVLVGDKKICGILTEMKSKLDGIDFVIVGIGINVNQYAEEFDEAIKHLATSLLIETERVFPRSEVLKKVLAQVGELYYRRRHCGFEEIKNKWIKASGMLGRQIAVAFKEETLSGRIIDIDDYGSLICQKNDGTIVEISAGDATILKE